MLPHYANLVITCLFLYYLKAQRRTPRKSVAYAWNSSYDACLIQNNKACNDLLLYIFKHDSRKSAVQLLLVFLLWKEAKITMQWSHVKTFEFFCHYFNCLTSIFFVLFLRDKFWCFYHFLWGFWLKRKWTIHGNIYNTNEKLNPVSNKICNFYVKRKKKKIIF